MRLALLLVASWLAGVAPAALAHDVGVSYLDLAVREGGVDGRLKLAVREVVAELRLDRDGDGAVTERDLALAGGAALSGAALGGYRVLQGGAACALAPGTAALEPPDGLVLTASWTCPGPIERLEVSAGLLDALPRGHVLLATIRTGGAVAERVLRAGSASFQIDPPRGSTAGSARFVALGLEHIFMGYDHLAFLLGLLLLGGTLRALVRIVTSFTVAHSVTLALATLGLVTPPARLVEPLIAASIVFVAAENLWALRRAAGPAALAAAASRRWRITFAFGLVHGFGFAGVLRDMHLPRGGLAASLVAFNLGVELGQLAVVALALPLLALLRRRSALAPRGVAAGSLALGALGLFWLVQRATSG
jgi:hypothetical protein